MFNEIGKKIKKLAEILCWIGIIVSIIMTFVLWGIGADSYELESYILIGLIVGILGSLTSWVGSFFMFGFGDLIDSTAQLKEKFCGNSNNTAIVAKQEPIQKTDSEANHTPAPVNRFVVTVPDVISVPKEKNTKMCLACGRVLPVTQKECPCGSESFDDDKNI